MAGSRRLLSRLRALMAAGVDGGGEAALHDVTMLIAGELVAEVCAIYDLCDEVCTASV